MCTHCVVKYVLLVIYILEQAAFLRALQADIVHAHLTICRVVSAMQIQHYCLITAGDLCRKKSFRAD